MDDVWVGEIYNTPLDSIEGDLSPHTLQTIYFSNINENKISDREKLMNPRKAFQAGNNPQ